LSIVWLEHIKDFPDPNLGDNEGLLAIGGELTPEWLLKAYRMGIFPWFNAGDPIMWWSPNPRMILYPKEFKVSKSFRNILNKKKHVVTFNRNFQEVIQYCGEIKRMGQEGTWLTSEMKSAYLTLHKMGWAHSIEVWNESELVGGLYGLAMGKLFFGESMFSKESNASKIALYSLSQLLITKGFEFIDCQIYTSHLESLGAKEVERTEFIKLVQNQTNLEQVIL